MLSLTYSNLISFGVHIGHTFQNTIFMSAWMLFSMRQNIWIINLFKTIYMFRIGFKCLKDVISKGGPIWFINLDKTMERYVSYNANRAGEFYLCNYWPKGIVSNFKEVQKSFKNFKLLSSLNLKIRKRKFFKNLFETSWLFTRFSWPRFLFVSNVLSCPSSVSEALKLGIYCLAIVDTNVLSNAISVAVPGNDESLYSIIFYNELICNYILLCKFKSIILWFTNIRNYKRLKFLKNSLLVSEEIKWPVLFSTNKFFLDSLNTVFYKNSSYSSAMQSVFYKGDFSYSLYSLENVLRRKLRLFFLISRWYCFKHAVKRKFFFSGLLKSRKWRKGKLIIFWKRRLKKILEKNIKFGFKTLQYLWRFVNVKTYKKYIKNDLWFSRVWSSYFLNYMSLFYQVYSSVNCVDYLFILDVYKKYSNRVPWAFVFKYFSRLNKSQIFFSNKNKYSRFLNYLSFTSFFFLFKNSLFYYLAFPLKKFSSSLSDKVYSIKLPFVKFNYKKIFVVKKVKKKKKFSLGFWSFNKIIYMFFWKKLSYITLPLSLKFFFKYVLKGKMIDKIIDYELVKILNLHELVYLKKLKYINYAKTRLDIF